MLWNGFQRPKRVEIEQETLSETYGKFVAQPFERGFATTLGNSLRRCLLSSIEGAAITAIKIEGVPHEFSSIPGVVEDVTDIILNLKQIPMRIHTDDPKIVVLEASEAGAVKASALSSDPSVEIVDPAVHIATINEDADFRVQLQVRRGRGYISAEKNIDEELGLGWIPVDSAHSPVRRVNYRVEAARIGRNTDYERLILEVWTNGTISPEEAVSRASLLLTEHLGIYIDAEDTARADEGVSAADPAGLDGLLSKTVDELDLSVRSANCLKNANIHTLRDLVRRSEKDMLETKNFGRKSLEELQDLLSRLGLRFGMDVPDRPGVSA